MTATRNLTRQAGVSRAKAAPEERPMPISKFASDPEPQSPVLPAEGYPYSEPGLRDWFRRTYARAASERELGTLMAAMATRDDKAGPGEPRPEPGGWRVVPVDAPDPPNDLGRK